MRQQGIKAPSGSKAVFYLRVSDKAQERKGDGLGSQEACCHEYARSRGYEVVEVFRETLTGGTSNRPVMLALLKYLREHRKEGRVVIIDNLNRFSREGPLGYWPLKFELQKAGGLLESPSFQFGDDPGSVFQENVLSAVAQLQREQNAEQTKNRMRGRVLNGYWPFATPVGFRHVLKPGEGKIVVRNEPLASIVQEGLEGFAAGRFHSQGELKRFFESYPNFPRNGNGEVRWQQVRDILARPFYAGYVEAPNWNIPLRKGRHQGLIDFQTFERIQKRLDDVSYAPARADMSADFPLRGAVACGECGKPLTGYYSTSKTGLKHAYYMCFARGCPRCRKSIPRQKIENEFVGLLARLTPGPRLRAMARAMFKDAWSQRTVQAAELKKSYQDEIRKADKEVQSLLTRLVSADSPAVIGAYEKRIAKLEQQKLLLAEKAQSVGVSKGTFEELFELSMQFLASPLKIWDLGTLEYRKLVLRLTFSEHLAYCPIQGFRTPKTALPFKVLGGFSAANGAMVRPRGFEPLSPP